MCVEVVVVRPLKEAQESRKKNQKNIDCRFLFEPVWQTDDYVQSVSEWQLPSVIFRGEEKDVVIKSQML